MSTRGEDHGPRVPTEADAAQWRIVPGPFPLTDPDAAVSRAFYVAIVSAFTLNAVAFYAVFADNGPGLDSGWLSVTFGLCMASYLGWIGWRAWWDMRYRQVSRVTPPFQGRLVRRHLTRAKDSDYSDTFYVVVDQGPGTMAHRFTIDGRDYDRLVEGHLVRVRMPQEHGGRSHIERIGDQRGDG